MPLLCQLVFLSVLSSGGTCIEENVLGVFWGGLAIPKGRYKLCVAVGLAIHFSLFVIIYNCPPTPLNFSTNDTIF